MKINRTISLICIILLLWIPVCVAGTYYSDNATSSTNWAAAQNISTPCTPETAMQNATAGDTVYFRGGIYALPFITLPECSTRWKTGLIAPSNNGTSENPITFIAYPEEIPFLDNSANEGQCNVVASFGTDGQDYIIWDGFHTKVVPCLGHAAGRGWGAQIHQSDHIIVRNCDIEGNLTGDSNNSPVRVEHADYPEIYNNKLYNSKGSAYNCCGIMSYYMHYAKVYNNDIYNCYTGVYDKQDGQYNEYYLNHIWDCNGSFRLMVALWQCHGIKVYQNIIRDNTSDFTIHIEGGSANDTATDFYIYNNVVYDTPSGVKEDDVGMTNIQIYNNIVSGVTTGAFLYSEGTEYVNYNCYYNIDRWHWNGWDAEHKYYTLADWKVGSGVDLQSINANPNFVDANGTSPEDFKLQAGSPALTLGVDRQDHDGDGNTTETIPAGAYITGSETIGYDDGSGNGESSSGSVLSGVTPAGITFK